ncbi:MAG: EAL domain-containing protein [Microthrixaceae bacterium]
MVDSQLATVVLVALALLTCVGCWIAGRATRRPASLAWYGFSIGSFLFLAARVVTVLSEMGGGSQGPAGDLLFIGGYFSLILSAVQLIRVRGRRRRWSDAIDAMIVVVSLGVTIWLVALGPLVVGSDLPPSGRILNICYFLLALLLFGLTTRLAVGPGATSPSYYFLAASFSLVFLVEIAHILDVSGVVPNDLAAAGAAAIWAMAGAGSMHSSRERLCEPAPDEGPAVLTKPRLALLGASLLIAPGVLLVAKTSGLVVDLWVLAVGWVLLAILVVLRFALLAKTQERAVDVQRIQGDANAALATATNREAMFKAGLVAVHAIVDDPEARVSIASFTDGSLRVNWSQGVDWEQAIATPVPLTRMPGRVVDSLDSLQSVVSDDGRAIDLRETDREGVGPSSVLIAPLVCQGHLDAMLILTTRRPLPNELRRIVETMCSTVSLALESAALTENLLRQQTERRFRVLVENSSDLVLVITDDRRITYASSAAGHLLGYGDDDLIGSDPQRWVHSRDWELLAPLFDRVADGEPEGGRSHEAPPPVRLRRSDGTYGWYEVSTRDLRHDPEIQGIVATAREISDRKAAEDRLAASEARFRALVQHSSDVVAVIDDDLIFSYVSPAIEPLLGLDPDRLIGCSALEVLGAEGAVQFLQNSTVVHEGRLPELSVQSHRFEVDAVHRSGAQVTLEVALTDLRDDPAVGGVVLNARDVSMRKTLEADLRHQAFHDGLTGLANRTMFADRITAALDAADLDTTTIAALFIDIDDFKIVNDSLGHAVGDHLLSEVAHRLVGHLGTSGTAARLGGDEFAVLVVTDEGEAAVAEMAERILSVVAEPFTIEGREIRVTCSIGIALAMRDDAGTTTDTKVLLRSADVAMYLAKDRGRNRAAMFEEHLHTTVFERMELKADLERALNSDQLRCHYQPIVSLRSGRITGLEALVRWKHPTRGFMSPDSFIPLAEDTGLIIGLGGKVLREACAQLRTWQLEVPGRSTLTMSVNLSVRQLMHEGIIAEVREVFDETGVDPATVTLEITETSLMHDTELTRHRLDQLRSLGCRLAVDDFGTGYSSLKYVQRFPIDLIKIDRAFVSGLGSGPDGGAVVASMVDLARRIGVATVAEGIEESSELEALQALGADYGQGYLFSRPLPVDQIDGLLAEPSPTSASSILV